MMKRRIMVMAVMAALWCCSWAVQAQDLKIGYVNTDSVFGTLPETQVQQKQLESYGKQLQARLQQKQQAMQQRYQEIVQKVQTASPEQQKAWEAELRQMQGELQKEQAAAQVNLNRKESELLEPLYEKIRTGIKMVAEQNGYTYVLSDNVLMYGEEVHDITGLVITALKQ